MVDPYIGFRKGRFQVISTAGREQNSGKMLYNCKCDCGTEFVARQNNLNRNTNSCGCLRREASSENSKRDPKHVVAMRLLNQCRRGDKERGLVCQLDLEAVSALIFSECHYCGTGPSTPTKLWRRVTSPNDSFLTNGIDRKENSIGYTKDNCVTCCTRCNYMKRDLGYEEFLSHIGKIFERLLW